ncbi:hypothetical protein FHG87_009696 [Trinorchestia longiramus]|nr:hypothetical protein FHG87_009696 [Trinorchestia longiramus]
MADEVITRAMLLTLRTLLNTHATNDEMQVRISVKGISRRKFGARTANTDLAAAALSNRLAMQGMGGGGGKGRGGGRGEWEGGGGGLIDTPLPAVLPLIQ